MDAMRFELQTQIGIGESTGKPRNRSFHKARAWHRHHDNQANASATRAVPLARLDVVDRYWRRQLTGLPFRA